MPHWKRNLALLWVSQLFVMVGFASTMPFIPLFVSDHLGISDPGPRGAVVAAFSFAATLGYGIFNPVWGALSDRVGVKPMLLRGTFSGVSAASSDSVSIISFFKKPSTFFISALPFSGLPVIQTQPMIMDRKRIYHVPEFLNSLFFRNPGKRKPDQPHS